MQRLTQRSINSIKAAFDAHKQSVALNEGWKFLHESYGIGKLKGKSLSLTGKDWLSIRSIVRHLTRYDLTQPLPAGSRVQVAAGTINEKWSREATQNQRVYAASLGAIPLTGGGSFEQPGAVFWIDYRTIDLTRLRRIVVVENQDVITHWHEYNLPLEISQAVALYRGHDGSAIALHALLTILPETVDVISFPDLDPAGMIIAAGLQHVAGLLTVEFPAQKENRELSSADVFQKQWVKFSNSSALIPAPWIPTWDLCAKHHISISQESMCAHYTALTVLPTKSTSRD